MLTLVDRLRAALAPDYQVERELGAGGMGRVYLARHITLDRLRAIKVIRPEMATGPMVERFQREAQLERVQRLWQRADRASARLLQDVQRQVGTCRR